VRNINQGSSGCQEGNAIEVRNAPFDGTHPNTKNVTIEDNEASNYQKTGILANGDVSVKIEENKVTGLGPVNFIAQNGIQLGFGAKGSVQENIISGNVYTPQTTASAGILLFDPSNGISVKENVVGASDVGIWVIGASSAVIRSNKVTSSTSDGIALDDQSGAPVNTNTVDKNNLSNNGVGIGLYGAGVTGNSVANNTAKNNGTGLFVGFGATSNTLSSNKAPNNTDDGIQVDANGNTITRNTALGNGNLDIENTGATTYSKNKCNTSSGPPVVCGMPPTATGAAPENVVGAPSPTIQIAKPFSR
jgi:parallel beta-helix repeat protein